MSDLELSEKYTDLAQSVLGKETARALLEDMWMFDKVNSSREFVEKYFDEGTKYSKN